MMARTRRVLIGWVVVLYLVAGCSAEATPQDDASSQAEAPPGSIQPSGWAPTGEEQAFDAETLYDLVDGQADSFFAYGFERVTVRNYESGAEEALRVEIWQLATPADAYGLFTTFRSGIPVDVGLEGDGDPGRRLDFWQDRYFVRLFAPQPLSDEALQTFATAISGSLPAGGEKPALLVHLPQEGLVERSGIFFHEEISIQDYLWLGGENVLELSQETEGVLARYDVTGESMSLLLVQYPDTAAAAAGLEALKAAGLNDLVAAQVHDRLLGAVLGGANVSEASALLSQALEDPQG
jgi:hypothetical protein